MQGEPNPNTHPTERESRSLTNIFLEQFTAFKRLDLNLDPGINVFIGANGTGKTHLLKVAYAACDITKTGLDFAEKLTRVFLPSGRVLGRLAKRQKERVMGRIDVCRGDKELHAFFYSDSENPASSVITGHDTWSKETIESVFIPVKEMLSHGPGFRSLYAQREVHFEEIYADILDRAYRPPLRGPLDSARRRILRDLQKAVEGEVTVKNEEFFLQTRHGDLEFTLLAEGMRKLGLLWLLVQNGTLLNGSVLFWDEPETNLNPKLCEVLIDILLQLQRLGVQILIATHDFAILKELELQMTAGDQVRFHALYRGASDGELRCESASLPFQLQHSPIDEAFSSLYDREIERSLGGDG